MSAVVIRQFITVYKKKALMTGGFISAILSLAEINPPVSHCAACDGRQAVERQERHAHRPGRAPPLFGPPTCS